MLEMLVKSKEKSLIIMFASIIIANRMNQRTNILLIQSKHSLRRQSVLRKRDKHLNVKFVRKSLTH